MAITVTATPSVLSNLAAEPFVFGFSITPVETATEIRRFGYQLCLFANSVETAVSAKELVKPTDGEVFYIDFQQDVCTLVSTAVPECDNSVEPQPEMLAVVRLKIFEHVFNKDTCAITIENEQTLGDYRVLNAANQYWGIQILGSGGWQWLNPMAEEVELCRSRCNLIYIWSSSSIDIEMTARSISGSDYQVVRTNASDVNAFLIDPSEFAALMNGTEAATTEENLQRIVYIKVEVDGTELVKFVLNTCCDIHRIAWQHSGGGYSYMNFEGQRKLSVQSRLTEVYRFQDKLFNLSPTLTATRTTNGRSIGVKTSFKRITLTKHLDADTDRDLRYIEDFLASGSYFLEFEAFTGTYDPGPPTYQLVKFIIDGGSVQYHEDDNFYVLTVTGKINQEHQMPNFAI